MSRAERNRRGVALLEAIAALAVLAIGALSAVTLARQAALSVERAQAADERTRRASVFLDAVSLWSRDELDHRLGSRAQGPWRLYIDRPTPALYRVALYDSAGGPPLLETALFRAEPSRAIQ